MCSNCAMPAHLVAYAYTLDDICVCELCSKRYMRYLRIGQCAPDARCAACGGLAALAIEQKEGTCQRA